MLDLVIFSPTLAKLGIIDSYISFRWTRKYSKCGSFELHCASTTSGLEYLVRDNIIYKPGDVEAGVINTIHVKTDAEGKEITIAKGTFLTGYLARRLIWGSEILTGAAELSMRTLVTKNCIAPSDSARIIPLLELAPIQNLVEAIDYQSSYKNLLEELDIMASVTQLGYRIRFDLTNKKLIFEVYKGLDRTEGQSTNPRAIFSKEFDNILESEYIDSLNNYANVVLVGGTQDDPYYEKFMTVGNAVGLARFEIFNDQSGIPTQDENGYLTTTAYNNLLIGKGNEVLAETTELKTFTSTISTDGNLKYKVDFDLGDIITIVSKRLGLTLDTRIAEIEEVYEVTGLKINVIFGNNIPTILDKIKGMNKNQSASGGINIPPLTKIDGGTFV